jgi:hypothetical protein
MSCATASPKVCHTARHAAWHTDNHLQAA